MKIDLMRDPGRQLNIPVPPEQVTALRVWHCKYKSLRAIEACVNLRTLVIATLPDDSIDFVAGLKQLECLRILHLPKISEVSPLAGLNALRCLSLTTLPSWDSSRKRTVIDTLEPITALPSLRHLELLRVVSADGSLEPLLQLHHLENARISGYRRDEMMRFYATTQARDGFNPRCEFD